MEVSANTNEKCLGDCISTYSNRILSLEARFSGPLGYQNPESPSNSDHLPVFRPADQLTLDKYLGIKPSSNQV
jgi:hypothetical protein